MNSKKILSLLLSSILIFSLTLNINTVNTQAATSSSRSASVNATYQTRDGFYDLNDSSVNRMSSEHFQIIWGNNDTTGTVNKSLVEGNLENLENIRDFYINQMGLDDPGISMNTSDTNSRYKTNLYIANTGLSNIESD